MFKNLTFYEYLFKKMLKSVSTYVTGAIALLPIWIMIITQLSSGGTKESSLAMLSFFTFPVMIIFMSFKASQVFRDEIENKTLLTIQAKPITRKQMVYQGLLAINTFSVILVFAGGLVPFMIAMIHGGPELLAHGALLSLTEILLLGIISVVALLLSLSLSGKAFIGVMIGGFVVAFYVLFGITMLLNIFGSRSQKAGDIVQQTGVSAEHERVDLTGVNSATDIDAITKSAKEIYSYDDNTHEKFIVSQSDIELAIFRTKLASIIGEPVSFMQGEDEKTIRDIALFYAKDPNDSTKTDAVKAVVFPYQFTDAEKTSLLDTYKDAIKSMFSNKNTDPNKYIITLKPEAKAKYDELKDINKATTSTITAWFNPVVHWTTMFAATSTATSKDLKAGGLDVWNILTANSKVHVSELKPVDPADLSKGYTFTVSIEDTTLVPVWYPYLLWIAIAGISMPFAIRSITRKNIA